MRRFFSLLIVTAGVSACGPAPAPPSPVNATHTIARDIALAADTTLVSARVAAGATVASILRTHDVVAADAVALVARAAAVFDLRKVRAHQLYVLVKDAEGLLRRFEYEIDGDRLLSVVRTGPEVDASLVADVQPIPKTRQVETVHGRIDREHPSLVSALDAAGESIDLTIALADIFESTSRPRSSLAILRAVGGKAVPRGSPVRRGTGRSSRRSSQTPGAVRQAVHAGGRLARRTDERGVSMRRFFLASP